MNANAMKEMGTLQECGKIIAFSKSFIPCDKLYKSYSFL